MSLTLIVHVHFALLCGLLPSLPAPVLTGVLLYSAIFFYHSMSAVLFSMQFVV